MTLRIQKRVGLGVIALFAIAGLTTAVVHRMQAQQSETPVWSPIGPTPSARVQSPANPQHFDDGRVSSIAVDPSDSSHWLIGAGNGGVWETRDSGTSFTPLSDAWPTLAIGAVAFAPSDPKIVYVGTGEPDDWLFEHAGLGMMKSTDGGRTWNLVAESSFARGSVKRIRVHPTNPNTLVAATLRGGFGRDYHPGSPSPPQFGVLKSVDGGLTWTRTLAGQATALEIDPTNFNNQYAAIGDQRVGALKDTPGAVPNAVYRSTDGGQTWALVPGPWGTSTLTKAAAGRVELALAPSNPNVLYVSLQKPVSTSINDGDDELTQSVNQDLLGLYRTDNAWAATPTWIQVPTAATGPHGYCSDGFSGCGYTHVLSVDPSDPNTVFAAGGHINLWRCTDCGTSPTWVNTILNKNVPGDHHALAWAGNRLIDGQDHGLWSTPDRGDTWQSHNATLAMETFVSAVLHQSNPDRVLGSVRDIGGVLWRTGEQIWPIFTSPSFELGEGEVAMSAARPDADWSGSHGFGSLYRSRDGGQTWIDAGSGIDLSGPAIGGAAALTPVRKCPGNDDVFLTGTNRMWRTDNFFNSPAPTWTPNGAANSSLSPDGTRSPGSILSIEFVESDTSCNSYAYGNRGGQVSLTRDGGKTWTDLDPSKNLPPRPINGLAFDPANPNVLYAAISSFDDATPGKPGHVFKTTNALAASPTWVNVSPPLNQPFDVIRVDPTNPKLIYAGSDTGLWRSVDGGVTWVHDGPESGLPNASIYDIKINPKTGVTAVFTYGRGAYAIGVPQGPQIASGPRSPANGGTYIAGGLVPGSWAQVQGTNLSRVTRTWDGSDFVDLGNRLPAKLSGVEVKVNGISAAVYYVSPTQVSFQVPSGILDGPAGNVLVSNSVTVQVLRDGVGSNALTTTATSSSPGIFPVIVNGKNYPAGVFTDGKITGDPAAGAVFRKARPGDAIQLYATGVIRQPGGVLPTSQTVAGVTVKIGDISLTPEFAGLVQVGEFQINFRIPQQFATLPEGDYPISVQYKLDDGATTSSPVTINSDPPGPLVIPIQH